MCINRAMRTVSEQYAPLLEGTVELLVKCYAAVYHAKLLDSASHVSGYQFYNFDNSQFLVVFCVQ